MRRGRDAETLNGLRRVEGRAGRGMPGYSKAEHQRLKAGLGLHRHHAARIVRSCALAAADEADFVHLARSSGLELRPRYSADRTAVTGYSAGLTDTSGTVLWYGAGGRLAADLTLPRLREHWPSPAPHTQAATLAAWSRPRGAAVLEEAPARRSDASRPVPAGAWAKAAERVDRLTAQLAATPLHDVAAWSTATRHTAAVIAALSLRIETTPGPMTRLADQLAAAAQTPPGQPRVPMRPGALADMRGVAIVARNAPPHPTWTMLLHALTALTHTIAGAQHTSRPRLAAHLATGLARTRTAYPLPSARALAAQQRSPGTPGPTQRPRPPLARPPAVRRDPPGRGRGRGR